MAVFDNIVSGYDLGLLPLELAALRELRRHAFPPLQGRVLELGVGTGVNLPLYGPGAQVVALELSGPMLARARRRPARAVVRPLQADAQWLPFADGVFDAVSGSLLFCSLAEPARALAEVRRVLRPCGRLVLVEHTRGRGLGAWLTDALHPLWYAFNGACHLNRRTVQMVAAAGFELTRVEERVMGIFRMIEAKV